VSSVEINKALRVDKLAALVWDQGKIVKDKISLSERREKCINE